MSQLLSLKSLMLSVFATVFISSAMADDWPQWRGPNRDGVWKETGILDRFPSEQLEILWRVPIGAGYCGPTVADGRLYVMDRQIEPSQVERILCFDAKSGAELWSHSYACEYSISYPAGPRASVTVEDGRAYALGAMGHFHCLDASSGLELWKKDLSSEYEIRTPIWGIAAAPLIYEDLVILQIGGAGTACVIALHKKDGDQQWSALSDRASYSAPIIVEQAGRPVVICWTGDSVAGLDPSSGSVFWQHSFPPRNMIIGVPTPVIKKDLLFVSSFYDGSLMLRMNQDRPAVELVWKRSGANEKNTDALHCMIGTPILTDDYIYGVDSYGELRCLDAETGDRIWEDQTATPRARWSTIHMVTNQDRVWMFNERGQLIIARLSSQGFDEISRTQLISPTTVQLRQRGGVCWSHPAFANRHIFARNDTELVCASLEAER